MSTVVVGAYFKALRNRYGWSQQEAMDLVSKYLGKNVTKTILSNLETGKTWPEGDTLTALIAVLQANIAHIVELQRDDKATEDLARKMAEDWFDREQLGRLDHIIANTKPDQYAAILADVRRELLRDPTLESNLRSFLARGR